VCIFENTAIAHLAPGSVIELSKLAQSGLGITCETEFAMRLPRYEIIAQTVRS
jgi:hypothetical protein